MWPRRNARREAPQTAPGALWGDEPAPGERYYIHGRLILCVTPWDAGLWEMVGDEHVRLVDAFTFTARWPCG